MDHPLLNKSVARSPRIVDLVFIAEPSGRWRRLAWGGVAVLSLYGGVFALVNHLGNSLGPWSAAMAARIHDAIAMERAVDLPAPPPPPARPAPETPQAAASSAVRASRVARGRSAAPAQAGKLAAASSEPVDFTGAAFIVGSGTSYAGGTTTSSGTNRNAVLGAVVSSGTGASIRQIRSRPVALDQSAWNCPWPAEADAEQVNEQTVVLRADVRSDGRADRVDVLSDPGFGFGVAARLCALRTRFEPARDGAGQPIAAQSPPIRVHFFR
jgi:protein TonB